MNLAEARSIIGMVLDPLSVDDFLDSIGREVLGATGDAGHPRTGLFGPDPRRTVLQAFGTHATQLGCHAVAPRQPPPTPSEVADADAFLSLIKSFHERDYTVTVPDVAPLSPALQQFARALELLLHQPVSASLFWSKAGAKAIVHYDNRDNITVQLSGRKRWFISTDPPGLENNWKHLGEAPPQLSRHKVIDVGPGDLIYIPRGTPHTVESTTESLHLAILFTPTTLRDVIIAALDQLSDLDRTFRETAVRHSTEVAEDSPAKVVGGIARLLAQCERPGFVAQAMQHRSSRFVGDLPALPKVPIPTGLTPATRVAHAELAVCHLRNLPGIIDFAHPGSRIAIHEGAEPALRFVQESSSFRIGAIPGLTDDVRIALVGRLIASGFLRLAD